VPYERVYDHVLPGDDQAAADLVVAVLGD